MKLYYSVGIFLIISFVEVIFCANQTTTVIVPTTATTSTTTTTTSTTTSTSTELPVITTVAPKPDTDVFYLTDKNGKICLILDLSTDFKVKYSTESKENKTLTVSLAKPNATKVTGNCSESTTSLQLSWKPTNNTATPWIANITLTNSSDTFFVSSFQVTYKQSEELFVNISSNEKNKLKTISAQSNDSNSTVILFKTSHGGYYQCVSDIDIPFTLNATMTVHSIRLVAFTKQNDTHFSGSRYQCPHDAFMHNIVPIIVGCTLAALILLVLIVYMVARKRAHSGYQTI